MADVTPLERAARALHEASKPVEYHRDPRRPSEPPVEIDGEFVAWDALSDGDRAGYEAKVRAVIAAIREPSEGMGMAAEHSELSTSYGGEDSFDYLSAKDAQEVWHKMIDALLAESPRQ